MSFKYALPVVLVLGSLTFSVPLSAQDQKAGKVQNQSVPLVAGHNVVDAVDDVRESVGDLINSIVEADEGLNLKDWDKKESQLVSMNAKLDKMEETLDAKAEATDSSWLNWMADRDYSVTVHDQINTLSQQLSEVATILSEAKAAPSLQIIVGDDVIDQVGNVRETVDDLVHAINDAGPELGWFDDPDYFVGMLQKLENMEAELDRKAEWSDEDWGNYYGSTDFQVNVHDQVDELSKMLEKIVDSVRTS